MRHSLTLTGTLTEYAADPTPGFEKVVYQRVGEGLGNLPGNGSYNHQRRRHVIPSNPRTEPQQARRERFALAVSTWQSLSPAQKDDWRKRGRSRSLPGYQTFLGFFMRSV